MNEDEKKDLQLPNLESVSDSNFSDANEFAVQDLTELYKLIVSMKREQRERLFVDLGDSLGIETRRWLDYTSTYSALFDDFANAIISIESSDLSSNQKSELMQQTEIIAAKILSSDKNNDYRAVQIDYENAMNELRLLKEQVLKQSREDAAVTKMEKFVIKCGKNGSPWFYESSNEIENLEFIRERRQQIIGKVIDESGNVLTVNTSEETIKWLKELQEKDTESSGESNYSCENCEGGCKCCE